MKQNLIASALATVLALTTGLALAAEQDPVQDRTQIQQEIYGSQLMTEQERMEFRQKMRTAKTLEQRQQIRNEHHERMKKRAQEQGMTLPDEPPTRGGGMGPGGGMRGGR
ncbi:MAG: hypothetical protein OQK32_02295 [Gammaproteobacteria bacterium]|nr:hypothetical protein [Gammaproteobacteria bacterium]MCW8923345.1 hypothetical protein [Gammaproteobacteria bacterium]